MPSDIYDSDDAMNRSPPLVAQKIKYEVEEPPPPFVSAADHEASEKSAKGTSDRSRKLHLPETQAQTRHGDSVLISHLAPARPDIADYARDHPLSLTDWSPKPDRGPLERPPFREEQRNSFSAAAVVYPLPGTEGVGRSRSPPTRYPTLPPPAPPRAINNDPRRPRLLSITAPPDRRASEDRPRLSPPFKDSAHPSPGSGVTLPSLQSLQSPPSSCAGTSPDTGSANSQALPSIHSALGGFSPNDLPSTRPGLPSSFPYSNPPAATSRNDSPHDRHLPGQFQVPQSPFSHFSPVSLKDASTNASPASQSSFWRTVPAPPPPSSDAHPATPYDMSPMTAQSPATSYPTPIDQVPPEVGERGSFSSTSGTSGAQGSYKCTHPGCTAAPFQTQYLLNSHANVHSQDRPHFCPVEGCPRAIGGKGFKRKNEMMRHGLVHNSPGYVCPFCPDQQHKYPRPDNLQRHVRVHHVDKNKDDPILRQVLAQRPMGSTRGRRRRINS